MSKDLLYRLIYSAALVVLFPGCHKTDSSSIAYNTEFTTYNLGFQDELVNILRFPHIIKIKVPDSITSGENAIANFTLSSGAEAKINNVKQYSGTTKNNFEKNLVYTISSADKSKQVNWLVIASNNDYSINWGLGHFVKKKFSSERNYDWYIDQGQTGPYSNINCGPASATMAIKWSDSTFNKSAQDARLNYEHDSIEWTTFDIDNYLNDNHVPHSIIPLKSDAQQTQLSFVRQLDLGHILLLCIDMNYIRSSINPSYRTDKFYLNRNKGGHFFIIKGYIQVDDEFYFQIYDPNSFSEANDDGTPRGKNRFYRATDIFDACYNWWRSAFVIGKKGCFNSY